MIVDRRSGGEAAWCDGWHHDPVKRIEALAAVWGGILPAGKVYEIRSMIGRMPRPVAGLDEGFAAVLQGETRRILGRANTGNETDDDDRRRKLTPSDVGLDLVAGLPYAEAHGRVSAWLQLAMVAREFAATEGGR